MAIQQSVHRLESEKKARGMPIYASDINMPNMAYMKILLPEFPHARIRSIDTSSAEEAEGVLAVLTAADVVNNEYGFVNTDQPVLCGPGAAKPDTDRVRYIGDKVALVIAESEDAASRALGLIKVDYEKLPVLDDPFYAMKPGAPVLHDYLEDNIFSHRVVRTGDMQKGFAEADVIVEGDYSTPAQEHMFFEPESGTGYVDEDGVLTVHVAGQWPHNDQRQICHALDLPDDKVRVVYPYIGGAFGGREDVSIQIVVALAAWKLHERGINRPVKLTLSREESLRIHGKRHPYHIHARWGATREGKITAAEVSMVADGGAYICTSVFVAGNTLINCTGPYVIPNVQVDVRTVYTNNIPKAAFRGFGGPQAGFAAEMQMAKLAEELDMDPVELRMKNMAREGDLQTVGSPFPPGMTMGEVVEQCALASGWVQSEQGWTRSPYAPDSGPDSHLKRGIGFACAHKNVGFSFGFREFCGVTIELHGEAEITRAVIHHGAADVGQGIHTVLTQMAAEALSLPLDKIELVAADTGTSLDAGSVSASRMTFVAGNAIREAAELVLDKWRAEERPAVVEHMFRADPTTAPDPETGQCDPNVAYGYAAEVAEVEVDTETGMIRVLRILCAEDVGKAMNPDIVVGQIQGGLLQGVGYTIMEEFLEKDGQVLTPSFSTYLIPTVLDIPDQMDTLILEYPDPRGPWGARGIGEMAILPTAPAIIAAVHDATGSWFDEFTLTPERVLKGLGRI